MFVQRHKKLVLGLLALLMLVSLFSLKFIKYNNNIEAMLPADSQVQQAMRFLRESNFSDKLVISLKLNEPDRTTEELISATDQLANAIAGSALVNQVIGSISSADFIQEMIFFLQYSPQLTSPESLAKLDSQLTAAGIKERLSFIYRQSLSLGSAFSVPFLQADPLNLSSSILTNIQKLSQASGYNVTLNRGHFISPDGRSAMIIVKTSVLLTEGFGSRKIVNYLQEKLKTLPNYINADIIAGHMHTVKNEDLIKSDIRLTSIIAALGFILLFLFIFRDWRAMIIFLMPLGAVLITTGVTFLVFKSLSYFVIGLSTVIAGITIDYGIYVYLAVRKAGNHPQTIRNIRPPMICGALTTISVFVVFFFSSVKGYHQLAFFSNFTILLCLGFVLFILPHFIYQETKPPKVKLAVKYNFKLPDGLNLILWLSLIIFMLSTTAHLKFNNDITQFDAAGPQVAKSEEEFQHTWGNQELPAIFVVTAPTLEQAYEINAQVYADALLAVGPENFRSFAQIWPGRKQRQANLDAWIKFWTPEKKRKFRDLLAQQGKQFDFSQSAFSPFDRQLDRPLSLDQDPQNLAFFKQLKDQFVLEKKEECQILSFFPDQEKLITQFSKIQLNYPGSFLVSRKNFSRQISEALSGEFFYLVILALLATLGLMAILLKNFRLTVLAVIPVVTSLAFIGGITGLTGLSLNIPSVIAAMVIIGIVSDYGIFMVYYCKYKYQTGTITAVTLAAVTTLIGAGVLLFAQHPVLFSIGLTLVSGVLSGYLSSLLVIPAAYRLWKVKEDVQD